MTFDSRRILAIETCTAAGSVAVLHSPDAADEKVLANNEWLRSRSHAEVATPAIEDALKVAGLTWSAIELIAVGVGPGSFTGIRVGLNAARAIAWSLNLPVVPIRSTDAMIEAARCSGMASKGSLIVAILNAQMGLLFSAWESPIEGHRHEVTDPAAMDVTTLATALKQLNRPITLIGENADVTANDLRDLGLVIYRPAARYLDFPSALTVARLAARKVRIQKIPTSEISALVGLYRWSNVQPLYIRGSGAEEKA